MCCIPGSQEFRLPSSRKVKPTLSQLQLSQVTYRLFSLDFSRVESLSLWGRPVASRKVCVWRGPGARAAPAASDDRCTMVVLGARRNVMPIWCSGASMRTTLHSDNQRPAFAPLQPTPKRECGCWFGLQLCTTIYPVRTGSQSTHHSR